MGADPAPTWAVALEQGATLAARLGTSVLVEGGHIPGECCPDALVPPSGAPEDRLVVDGRRVETANTHGTGCSLSSALATRFAITGDWPTALREAKSRLEGALLPAHLLDVGTGNGPVHHFHALGDLSGPGRFTDLAWRDTAGIRGDILALPFVVGLADGSLPADHFSYCLQQDALSLREYAGVLARTAARAPSEAEQRFWLAAAASCLGNEADLHRDWLLRETGRPGAGGDVRRRAGPRPPLRRVRAMLAAFR
ncbi:bifunctional hydroxymethylpyrimidine kinase/phosphomethylpyrimidine kinase [Arthrobacter antioxidans]|uniref:bifunctional hydroxymethylpyrimidine kinase/phosphomethylpyrimidine kinase n=1 Tax=Arthrobacter antioxidans TaxID=2895818 RepID=UPI001FFF725C|nr:bifunctional hydroxymethylpyrimidine kinase/phosphomethylpyrimidine kinase [Arthrobacter antioxidans]